MNQHHWAFNSSTKQVQKFPTRMFPEGWSYMSSEWASVCQGKSNRAKQNFVFFLNKNAELKGGFIPSPKHFGISK